MSEEYAGVNAARSAAKAANAENKTANRYADGPF